LGGYISNAARRAIGMGLAEIQDGAGLSISQNRLLQHKKKGNS